MLHNRALTGLAITLVILLLLVGHPARSAKRQQVIVETGAHGMVYGNLIGVAAAGPTQRDPIVFGNRDDDHAMKANTDGLSLASTYPQDSWTVVDISDCLEHPEDTVAVLLTGILVIGHRHDTNEVADIRICFRAYGQTYEAHWAAQVANFLKYEIERSTFSAWIPVSNGKFEFKRYFAPQIPEGPTVMDHTAYAFNVHLNGVLRNVTQ